MGAQYHNGHWYGGGQDIDIQSDPTATSFDPNKVPTGATAQSVLNSKILPVPSTVTSISITDSTWVAYEPASNGFITIKVGAGSSARSIRATIRDNLISEYGVTSMLTLPAYNTEPIISLPVFKGRKYVIYCSASGGGITASFIS